MGTWGHGNLDNDYALDELSTRQHELVSSLLQRAQRKTSRESDEWDYTTLFVEFEIVFAFETAGLLVGSKFPSPDAVRTLGAEFLAEWEPYYDKLGPSAEHKANRRAVIVDSFERFAKICETHEGKGPLPALVPEKALEPVAPEKPAKKAKKPPATKKPAKKPTKKLTKKRR